MKNIILTKQYFEEFNNPEIKLMVDKKVDFQIVVNDELIRYQNLALKSINILLRHRSFIEKNSLFTRDYTFQNFFSELYKFYNYYYSGKQFELKLESETYKDIYLRAYFTERDISLMDNFRKYDAEEFMHLGPDYNYDIRVIRKAAMNLLLNKVESSSKVYTELDLNTIHLWDYKFGLA